MVVEKFQIFSVKITANTLEKLKKSSKLKNVSVTSFDKFHNLCNLYIFGLCFVAQ